MFTQGTQRVLRAATAAIAVTAIAGAAQAGDIGVGRYHLGDHPAGNAQDPLYGLRLDGLDGNRDSIWTFSFDDSHSNESFAVNMMMEVSGDLDAGNGVIRIWGVLFGGRDAGSDWDSDTTNYWSVDMTYNNALRVGDRITVDDAFEGTNFGMMTALTTSDEFTAGDEVNLVDYAGNMGESFSLLHAHRGFAGISGIGWLTHDQYNGHVSASDWLFTATPVIPLPPAAFLGFGGLAAVAVSRRRMSN